ncbi:MAG: hypothetical protein B1H02_07705 [Candidatus Latescibacteria bacterium 4484_107]|nr:MAG: hypothetical protein B1H02_07705 [Candidatus Latescibacteria bacterium 4484_107]
MRVAQMSVDWKEDFDLDEVNRLAKRIFRAQPYHLYCYDQNHVDSKVIYLSDRHLSQEELDRLWNAGDLGAGDRDFWEGSFDDIIQQLKQNLIPDTTEEKGEESMELTQAQTESLKKVITYLDESEKKAYEEAGRPKDHIYAEVLKLKDAAK